MNVVLLLLFLMNSFSIDNANEFADKMAPYYDYNLRYEMHDIGTWYAATVYNGKCTSQVYLSPQFYGVLGEDDLWKGVLAHEWAHVGQETCANNERNADVTALNKLLEAGELSAYFRYMSFLKERWGWTDIDVNNVIEERNEKRILN